VIAELFRSMVVVIQRVVVVLRQVAVVQIAVVRSVMMIAQ